MSGPPIRIAYGHPSGQFEAIHLKSGKKFLAGNPGKAKKGLRAALGKGKGSGE